MKSLAIQLTGLILTDRTPVGLVIISLVLASLAGCASHKETILPQDGPTMQTIYEQHFHNIGAAESFALRRQLGTRAIEAGESGLAGYVRDAFNELDAHFPRLPNPTLVMYVFPHLAGEDRVPVPGYATTFPLYTRVEYALPGEVATGEHR